LAVLAQIAAYFIAVALPVAIIATIGALFGWKIAFLCLAAPILVLGLFGLSKASV